MQGKSIDKHLLECYVFKESQGALPDPSPFTPTIVKRYGGGGFFQQKSYKFCKVDDNL
jgi:hypothetical protein